MRFVLAILITLVCASTASAKNIGIDMTAAWWTEPQSAQLAELQHLHAEGGNITRVETPGLPYESPAQLRWLLQRAYSLHIRVFLGTGMGPGVASVVRRYPHEIIGVEVGNEPNNPNFFKGTACDYVHTMLAPTYRAVKAVDPHMPVVGGVEALTDPVWAQRLVACGGRAWMNVFSIHPYAVSFKDGMFNWYAPSLNVLYGIERIVRKPMWVTEFGYPTTVPQRAVWERKALREIAKMAFVKLTSLYCLTADFATPTLRLDTLYHRALIRLERK